MLRTVTRISDFVLFWAPYILILTGKIKLNVLYEVLEDDPRSTPGHLKVLDQIRSIMKFLIVAITEVLTKNLTKNFIFHHPLKSLKVISKNTNNVFFKCYCICQSTQKFMLKSAQLWAPWLQDSSFQHPFTPKLALKVVSENANNVYSEV